MFIDPSNMLNEMCGALPVSAEDAPGLQAGADRPHDMEVSYGGLDLHCYASPANEQLSRDLIDAARAEAVGG